jgi:hypothetical protein
VQRAPIFDEAQAPGGDLVHHPVAQEQHRVGDVFLNTAAGQGPLASLSGDQCGDALVLQPPEEAAQLGAQDDLVGERREQNLHRVQYDPFAPTESMACQADKEALQIVLAGLLDHAALDIGEIHGQQLLFLQVRQVETQGDQVLGQLLRGFLKGHEDAGLTVIDSPPHHKLHAQQGLAAAGTAAHQGGAPQGRPPPVISSRPWMPVGHLANCPPDGSSCVSISTIPSPPRRFWETVIFLYLMDYRQLIAILCPLDNICNENLPIVGRFIVRLPQVITLSR